MNEVADRAVVDPNAEVVIEYRGDLAVGSRLPSQLANEFVVGLQFGTGRLGWNDLENFRKRFVHELCHLPAVADVQTGAQQMPTRNPTDWAFVGRLVGPSAGPRKPKPKA